MPATARGKADEGGEDALQPPEGDFTPQKLLPWVALGMVFLVVMAWIVGSFMTLFILIIAVALLLWYLHQQCPSDDSFDAKRLLKRVKRGHHLADDDPEKPRGFLRENLGRLKASVSVETSRLTRTITPIATVAKIARVRVPEKREEHIWVGVAGRWIYYGAHELEEESYELTSSTSGTSAVT
jgi:hypothetical protein